MPPEREYTKRYTEPVPACSTCFPNRLGYPEWVAWSIANNVAGQYQRVCPECGLYRWPEEFVKPQQAAAVFTDGGCIQSNPSPHGGTWAFVHVNAEGEVIRKDCGVVIPRDAGLPSIENNLMEFIAIINALRILPDGWTGHVFTDNQNALRRMNDPHKAKMGGVPAVFVELARHVRGRLGSLNFTLLGGHPTRAELKEGRRRDGKPVSVHNATCDAMCCEAAAKFMAAKGGES